MENTQRKTNMISRYSALALLAVLNIAVGLSIATGIFPSPFLIQSDSSSQMSTDHNYDADWRGIGCLLLASGGSLLFVDGWLWSWRYG
jgi:hypothetical protein